MAMFRGPGRKVSTHTTDTPGEALAYGNGYRESFVRWALQRTVLRTIFRFLTMIATPIDGMAIVDMTVRYQVTDSQTD